MKVRKTLTFNENIYKLIKRVSENKKEAVGNFLESIFIEKLEEFEKKDPILKLEKKYIDYVSEDEQKELETELRNLNFKAGKELIKNKKTGKLELVNHK